MQNLQSDGIRIHIESPTWLTRNRMLLLIGSLMMLSKLSKRFDIHMRLPIAKRFAIYCCFSISLCWAVATGAADLGKRAPNVVMIVIDDQNDWIGCLNGHPQSRTPNIDRLAERGTLFLNAHCQSPLCNPSRTSVMTGLRPSSTGIYGLSPGLRDVADLKSTTTLPQNFRNHGYETLMAGKIYHGAYGRNPSDKEFDIVGPPSQIGPRPDSPLVKIPSGHPLVDWEHFLTKTKKREIGNLPVGQ